MKTLIERGPLVSAPYGNNLELAYLSLQYGKSKQIENQQLFLYLTEMKFQGKLPF